MTLIHLKKKDVVKTSVSGVAIEFDHLKLAFILGIPGNNGICEYIKDVWEESKYTKRLEITRKFANDETLTAARRVKSTPASPRTIHGSAESNRSSKESTLGWSIRHIPDSRNEQVVTEFERAGANRFQADLEKAQVENTRLLASLQQA
ncbi:hypothetical protein Dimus_025191 [Dionaea muscipula]